MDEQGEGGGWVNERMDKWMDRKGVGGGWSDA